MPDTDMLFHYTSQVGLSGILKENEIWGTNIHYLNDSSEFKHAFKLVRDIIPKYLSDAGKMGITNYFLKIFDENVEKVSPNICIFVTSFSGKGNLLSQWRGYCNEGTGYSIGFDRKTLEQVALDNDLELLDCIYTSEKQEIELEKCVKEILDQFQSGDPSVPRVAHTLYTSLTRISSKFKHASFSEEEEVRLVSKIVDFMDEKIEFRYGKSTLIPYLKFALVIKKIQNTVPLITKIYVGPTPDKNLAKLAVTNLLCKHKINSAVVELSEVPFKNW
jgi:hypothetical protein